MNLVMMEQSISRRFLIRWRRVAMMVGWLESTMQQVRKTIKFFHRGLWLLNIFLYYSRSHWRWTWLGKAIHDIIVRFIMTDLTETKCLLNLCTWVLQITGINVTLVQPQSRSLPDKRSPHNACYLQAPPLACLSVAVLKHAPQASGQHLVSLQREALSRAICCCSICRSDINF